MSIAFPYVLQRVRTWFPLGLGRDNVNEGTALNTEVSFVTDTNR